MLQLAPDGMLRPFFQFEPWCMIGLCRLCIGNSECLPIVIQIQIPLLEYAVELITVAIRAGRDGVS